MPRISSLPLICMFAASLFSTVSSRHVHGHRMHRHHRRQFATPIFQTAALTTTSIASLPSVTAAIEQRLKDVESMLASLLSGSAETTSAGTGPPPTSSATDYLPIPASSTQAPAPTHSSALCRPAAGAGPLIPCPTSRYTYTRTSTTQSTLNIQTPYPLSNVTIYEYPNGTAQPAYVYATASYASGDYPYASGVNPAQVSGNTVVSTFVTSSYQSAPTAYTFRPDAQDNVAVYYGQTPNTQPGGLLALCENPNVDIVILAFVYDFFSAQGYPSVDFGPGCSSFDGEQAARAPGLKNCSALQPEIVGCQQIGKKVLVSLGGYIANTSLSSDDQASQLASTLWSLFGGGPTDENGPLRPFGIASIDGFDIDNENHDTRYYETFATALRQKFDEDPSKTYYLSAAPQCPLPDASIPVGAMAQADFVWVQFYNNPSCDLNTNGFQASFAAWSANLSSALSPGKPRIYIGTGAFEGAGSGYVAGSALSSTIGLARELYVNNLGGMMLWDGSEGLANVDSYGVNYLEYAKSALQF